MYEKNVKTSPKKKEQKLTKKKKNENIESKNENGVQDSQYGSSDKAVSRYKAVIAWHDWGVALVTRNE